MTSSDCARAAFAAAILTCGTAASGLDQTPPAALRPADQEPATLESVEVVAEREKLRAALSSFVGKLAPTVGTNVARWHDPVCPWAAGVTPAEAKFITNRIRAIAESAGARVGTADHCEANLLVFLTDQPNELVEQLKAKSPRVFANATGQQTALQDGSHPVRVWQSAPMRNADGSPVDSSANKPPEYRLKDSRIVSGVTSGLAAIVVVVDTSNTGGATFGQLSDYVGMVALTRIDVNAELAGSQSILRLFHGTEKEPAPRGLTDWDEAFLAAVYGLRDAYQHETSVIVTRMMQKLEQPAG